MIGRRGTTEEVKVDDVILPNGAPLANLELNLVLEVLSKALPNMTLAP